MQHFLRKGQGIAHTLLGNQRWIQPPVSSCHRSGNNPKFPESAKSGSVGLPPPFAATAPIAARAVAEPRAENDLAPGAGTGISTAATAATCAGLRVARFRGGGARRTFSPLSAA